MKNIDKVQYHALNEQDIVDGKGKHTLHDSEFYIRVRRNGEWACAKTVRDEIVKGMSDKAKKDILETFAPCLGTFTKDIANYTAFDLAVKLGLNVGEAWKADAEAARKRVADALVEAQKKHDLKVDKIVKAGREVYQDEARTKAGKKWDAFKKERDERLKNRKIVVKKDALVKETKAVKQGKKIAKQCKKAK